MNWKALKNAECPQCGKKMKDAFVLENPYYCTCGFKISQEKFEKIVKDMYAPKQKTTEFLTEDERLSELNNMGRDKVSEDFSDSPHLK